MTLRKNKLSRSVAVEPLKIQIEKKGIIASLFGDSRVGRRCDRDGMGRNLPTNDDAAS